MTFASTVARRFLLLGAVSGFLAVALGAFGAHGLKRILDTDLLVIFETGVRYHFHHTLALLAVGLLAREGAGRALCASGWAFVAGIVVFSGSLYALALTGERWLGAITPIGGVSFLVGWGALGVAAWQRTRVVKA
ncbi:MAG: hypothetical protein PWP23_358 [Candidatus Sumerlaeota bacterium]|nr:hypothetical protein [Candidatus Sumerlaeota bacterium]